MHHMETTLSGFLTGVSKRVGGGGHHKGATCYCKMKQDIARYPVAGNRAGERESYGQSWWRVYLPKASADREARLLFYGLRETKDIKTIALFLV